MAERAVLVTRPAGQTAQLCRLLREAGFLPVEQPLIIIEPLAELPGAQQQLLVGLDSYQHVIFVSSNAVQFGMAWIHTFWPQLPPALHWYTVGDRSAAQLREFAIAVQFPTTQMDSEGLLQLPGLQSVAGDRVLIVKGEGGRRLLADRLGQRGARVDQVATYRRACPQLAAGSLQALLAQHRFAALMISSGEGLHNMLSLLPAADVPLVRGMLLVVPGERVAALAQQAGFTRLVVARNATDEAMLEALQTRFGKEE